MSGIGHNRRTEFLNRKLDERGMRGKDVDQLFDELAIEGRTSSY